MGVRVMCVYIRERETKRQTSRGREMEGEKKRETLTHKQNASCFNPQLLRIWQHFFSYPPLSLSLVKRAITCPGQSHIKQTLVLSPEPDSAKLHCFQMPITNPPSLQPPSSPPACFSSFYCSSFLLMFCSLFMSLYSSLNFLLSQVKMRDCE